MFGQHLRLKERRLKGQRKYRTNIKSRVQRFFSVIERLALHFSQNGGVCEGPNVKGERKLLKGIFFTLFIYFHRFAGVGLKYFIFYLAC